MSQALLLDRISKRYRRSLTPPTRLAEAIGGGRYVRRQSEEFWALRDVSFEVASGSTVAIIGRNGAGKSTLLKILAGVTSPSSGRAVLQGRVGALLEVGTGFHPELTGRENIYLSAAILGMSRTNVRRRVSDIVDFAGVESFIDTPIKRYSSGMVVRLGFSVAAHLDPEILIVDEVLAVGDADFRQRCIQRIEDSQKQGTTTILVSHDLRLAAQVASRAVWIDEGEVKADSNTSRVVEDYLDSVFTNTATASLDPIPTAAASLRSVEVIGAGGRPSAVFESSQPLSVSFCLETEDPVPGLRLISRFKKRDGTLALVCTTDDGPHPLNLQSRRGTANPVFKLPSGVLAPGRYAISVSLESRHGGILAEYGGICSFQVTDTHFSTNDGRGGAIGPIGRWSLNP